ncbi:MAG: Gfo/Idh/MocA family oxidoreductase [Oscillospiraceae bacterium]|nr:Gfo/Idh/MocA family oxidoreductase [Oscillospiraceae bacterium]
MKKYTVALAGLGARGKIHLGAILKNSDRFELVGVYDPNPKAVDATAALFGKLPVFGGAEDMLRAVKPDVFCFVTHPDVRLEYVKLGAACGVKAISFEKPMALSLKDAKEIQSICDQYDIKAVVSHQKKYLPAMQKFKEILNRAIIGQPYLIHATTGPWMAHLATHYVDLALWANNGIGADSVVGHVHGRGKLTDNHPSPDYLMMQATMKNGVRLILESGYYSPSHMARMGSDFWFDNRITVYGDNGYVWAQTNGEWGCLTPESPQMQKGAGEGWLVQEKKMQVPFYADLAGWLDDDRKPHTSNVGISCTGYEMLEAALLSALDNRRVDLPITDFDYEDVLTRMAATLP